MELTNQERKGTPEEEENYNYLERLQAGSVEQTKMKEKTRIDYFKRTRNHDIP